MLLTDSINYPRVYIVPEWPDYRQLNIGANTPARSYLVQAPCSTGTPIVALDGYQASWRGRYVSCIFHTEEALLERGYRCLSLADYATLEGVQVW